jgi:flagellar secretion chaperone FliS
MFAAVPSPFGRTAASAGAYRRIGVETGVSCATPHQLVSLLFDGCIDAIAQARGALQQGDAAAKGRAIGRAVRIVEEGLKAGLDLEAGGALAADLRALYGYIVLRLTRANLHNDDAALAECQRLIEPVREAWSRIASDAAPR